MQHVSQCDNCKHLSKKSVRNIIYFCSAYPEGIPDAIVINNWDHHLPYEGDHGILFEPIEGGQA